MKQYFHTAKKYIDTNKEIAVGLAVIVGFIVLMGGVAAVFMRSNQPAIVYQPAKACDLFTLAEAKDLLGEKTLNSSNQAPKVSGTTAISRCGYTDGNPETANMIVAAVTVRSGINDEGVARNKTEFATGKKATGIEAVKNVGNDAYFNSTRGQLNILSGNEWIIVSYGLGSDPLANKQDDAVKLAQNAL